MISSLSQPVADHIFRSLVEAYDQAEAGGNGEAFLSHLALLLAAEIGSDERLNQLITLAAQACSRG